MHRGNDTDELESIIDKLRADLRMLEESLDLALKERDDAMAETASSDSIRDALTVNLGIMCQTARKAFDERDEARRELCMVISGKGGKSAFASNDAVMEARLRGWDCFKENP